VTLRGEVIVSVPEQWIVPGTRVITDGWAAYNNLGAVGYIHQEVIHQYNFVAPHDNTIHTQNIENTWMRIKAKFSRMFGTNTELFPTYLQEYMWRQRATCTPSSRASSSTSGNSTL